MSTTETVRAWSTTNATNATADALIASSDSQSPDTVDNNIRSIMVAVKKQENDTGGALVAGGTANALTVTTGQVLEIGQLVAGLRLLIRATAVNTSATVTFAPDGLSGANIKRADGSALAIGDIRSGMMLDLVYNTGSSEWRCANIAPTGAGLASVVAYDAGQVVASTVVTTVTLGSEVFDVGSHFAANVWTPPAGTVSVSINTQILNSTGGTAQFIVSLVRSGTILQSVITPPCLNGQTISAFLSVIDQNIGSYSYYVSCQCAAQPYSISSPFFSGHMI